MSSLKKLETAGITIISSLSAACEQLRALLSIILDQQVQVKEQNMAKQLQGIIDEWILGKGRYPPTWKSLLEILASMDLKSLSEHTEDYLRGTIIIMYFNRVIS